MRTSGKMTTRWLMVLVALVGVNLAGARAAMGLRARKYPMSGSAAGNLYAMADGRLMLRPGRKGTVYREIQPPTAAGICRTCWPLGLSVGLTALVAATLLMGRRPGPGPRPQDHGDPPVSGHAPAPSVMGGSV